MKIISMHKINKIKGCKLRIFEAEDDDYPDRRIVRANERAIDHYLKYYSEEEKQELLKTIRWTNDDCATELLKLGWTVTRSVEKNE